MVTIDASTVDTLLNLAGQVPDKIIESWIDQSIDILNRYGADLPNMGGTAGSKTVSLESKERGAVMDVVRAIYYSFYKGIDTSTVGGLTVTSPDLLSNPTVMEAVKEAARQLAEIEVTYG